MTDLTIEMQVFIWWALAQLGSMLLRAGYSRSTLGTRYQTEKQCAATRQQCAATRHAENSARAADDESRVDELRKIRLLLIQVALRQGVDIDTIEEVIK
jgi:hypothetical protein